MLLRQKASKSDVLKFSKFLYESEHKEVDNSSNHEPKNKRVYTEGALQTDVINYLTLLENQGKLFFHRANVGGLFDRKTGVYRSLPPGVRKGFPDILIIKNGKFIGIELKDGKNKQSPEQEEIEQKILKQKGAYFVVRSLDFLIKILEDSF